MGLSPQVLDTDNATYITMERIPSMCLAEKYGDKIHHIPKWIRDEIVEILWRLYSEADIQYLDVTPYNFIEHEGRVWIIDFGHARVMNHLDPYLQVIFDTWKLRWNRWFK